MRLPPQATHDSSFIPYPTPPGDSFILKKSTIPRLGRHFGRATSHAKALGGCLSMTLQCVMEGLKNLRMVLKDPLYIPPRISADSDPGHFFEHLGVSEPNSPKREQPSDDLSCNTDRVIVQHGSVCHSEPHEQPLQESACSTDQVTVHQGSVCQGEQQEQPLPAPTSQCSIDQMTTDQIPTFAQAEDSESDMNPCSSISSTARESANKAVNNDGNHDARADDSDSEKLCRTVLAEKEEEANNKAVDDYDAAHRSSAHDVSGSDCGSHCGCYDHHHDYLASSHSCALECIPESESELSGVFAICEPETHDLHDQTDTGDDSSADKEEVAQHDDHTSMQQTVLAFELEAWPRGTENIDDEKTAEADACDQYNPFRTDAVTVTVPKLDSLDEATMSMSGSKHEAHATLHRAANLF
jgi:hypothetical protein